MKAFKLQTGEISGQSHKNPDSGNSSAEEFGNTVLKTFFANSDSYQYSRILQLKDSRNPDFYGIGRRFRELPAEMFCVCFRAMRQNVSPGNSRTRGKPIKISLADSVASSPAALPRCKRGKGILSWPSQDGRGRRRRTSMISVKFKVCDTR